MTLPDYLDLQQRLLPLYGDSKEAVRKWMRAPHPQLNNRRAIDCSYQEVLAVIERLESGAYL